MFNQTKNRNIEQINKKYEAKLKELKNYQNFEMANFDKITKGIAKPCARIQRIVSSTTGIQDDENDNEENNENEIKGGEEYDEEEEGEEENKNGNINETPFLHKKECKGLLYLCNVENYFLKNKKWVIVCEKCQAINNCKNFIWTCPKCNKRIRETNSDYDYSDNSYKKDFEYFNNNNISNKKEDKKEDKDINNLNKDISVDNNQINFSERMKMFNKENNNKKSDIKINESNKIKNDNVNETQKTFNKYETYTEGRIENYYEDNISKDGQYLVTISISKIVNEPVPKAYNNLYESNTYKGYNTYIDKAEDINYVGDYNCSNEKIKEIKNNEYQEDKKEKETNSKNKTNNNKFVNNYKCNERKENISTSKSSQTYQRMKKPIHKTQINVYNKESPEKNVKTVIKSYKKEVKIKDIRYKLLQLENPVSKNIKRTTSDNNKIITTSNKSSESNFSIGNNNNHKNKVKRIEDKLLDYGKALKQKKAQERVDKLKAEDQECTFKPKIKKKILKNNFSNTDFYTRAARLEEKKTLQCEKKRQEDESKRLKKENKILEDERIKLENEKKIIENEKKRQEEESAILKEEKKRQEEEKIRLEEENKKLLEEYKKQEEGNKRLENRKKKKI